MATTQYSHAASNDWRLAARAPNEIAKLIPNGSRVFVHGGAATPQALLQALVNSPTADDLTLYHLHLEGAVPFATPELSRRFHSVSLFTGASLRAGVSAGWADFMPVFLSDIPALFRSRAIPLSVALLQVSPPDAHGYCTLGTSVDIASAASEAADILLAEINEQMPRTHGTCTLHISKLHGYCTSNHPLPQNHLEPEGLVEAAIGEHISKLITDGSTLQVGIGSIPNAVLKRLTKKNDLGLHTEMFSDGMLPLLQSGVITNRYKRVLKGVSATGFIIGSQALYDFVNDNASIHFAPSDFINDTAVIRKNPKVVAINGALQVDITGQVCADSMGPRIFSGIGGQMDFIRGSALSEGGVPIIALPSTAKNGTISRIVPTLTQGSGVVTTRGHVHWVVTEYGAVNLHGKTLRERAELLTSICHPDFRDAISSAGASPAGSLPRESVVSHGLPQSLKAAPNT